MSFWPLRPRQPFIGLAIAAVLGIVAADHWEMPPGWAFALTAMGVLLVLLRPAVVTCWLLCSFVFFEVHTIRHYGSETRQFARFLDAGPRVVQVTGIVWNEPEKAGEKARLMTARLVLKTESLLISGERFSAPMLLSVDWAGAMPAYGDRVTLVGSATNLDERRNPGQFDFAGHQQRRGIHSVVRARFASDCRIEAHGQGVRLQALAYRASHWIQRQLQVGIDPPTPEISDLIASMVLGMRGETPEDLKELFQRTGTMHLFAVSGLNVAMLAGIILAILRPFAIRRAAAVVVIIPILAAYALVTGLTPSCVRATIMIALVLFGHVVDRRPLPMNSLGAAAFLILAWDTEQLFLLGFQFSFVLVVTIVWLAGSIERRLRRIGHPDEFLPRDLWSPPQRVRVFWMGKLALAMGVTISAWIGSLLFTAGHFHLFSPSTVLANLIAVPLAFGVLTLGLASVMVAPVWALGLKLFNNANWFLAKGLITSLGCIAQIPGSYIYVEKPRLAPKPDCEFTVFDLGDGGAAFVRAEGRDWLFDCGGENDYARILLPYLRSRGVNHLDGLLFTHGDARHLGAAWNVIDEFHPRALVDSVLKTPVGKRPLLHRDLNARGIPKGLYERGDFIHLGSGTTVRVLYPPAGLKRSVADDMVLVLQLDAGGRRALFMSDSGFSTERWLLENETDLRSDVLIKGHHVKDISGTPDFVARVEPQVIICGALNYGDPPAKLDPWVSQMAARGIAVFRQDRVGAVQVDMRADSVDVRSYLGGQTFRIRAR